MTNQQLSILFETFSFFFVAIDLYGRDRLDRTHNKLLLISDRITSLIEYVRDFDWSKSRSSKLMMLSYVLSALGAVYLMIDLMSFKDLLGSDGLSFGKVFSSIFVFIIMFGFTFGFVLLVVLLTISLMIFGALAMTWLIKLIFYGLSQLLRTINFEGLLLFIGSVLFVISKFLQLF